VSIVVCTGVIERLEFEKSSSKLTAVLRPRDLRLRPDVLFVCVCVCVCAVSGAASGDDVRFETIRPKDFDLKERIGKG
jgi:hypothetical protein